MRANCAERVVRQAQTTSLPSISALPLTADFFHQLARTELTAVGYQVLFWHMDRLIRHRMTSEAVPLETIAQALGLHRNAVGKAYTALAAAGLVRRQEVHQRGAPTRTCLEGIALHVVLQAAGKRSGPAPAIGDRRPVVPTGTAGPSKLEQQQSQAPVGDRSATASRPSYETERVTPAEPAPPAAPTYSPELQSQALAKLPFQARYDALQGRLTADVIDPAWDLSDDEKAFVLSMRLRERLREAKLQTKAPPCMKPVPTKAPKSIATALLQVRSQFDALVDKGALSQLGQAEQEAMAESSTLADGLLDQIAFMISKCNLGRGDTHAGIRAARSLVAQGRWMLPWTFTRDWYGAVHRGAEGTI